MAAQPLPGNNQSISGLSASNNSNLLAGQFGDVYIGESKSELCSTISCAEVVGS
jgi:hypothetical protein